jgi:hypothetical protein
MQARPAGEPRSQQAFFAWKLSHLASRAPLCAGWSPSPSLLPEPGAPRLPLRAAGAGAEEDRESLSELERGEAVGLAGGGPRGPAQLLAEEGAGPRAGGEGLGGAGVGRQRPVRRSGAGGSHDSEDVLRYGAAVAAAVPQLEGDGGEAQRTAGLSPLVSECDGEGAGEGGAFDGGHALGLGDTAGARYDVRLGSGVHSRSSSSNSSGSGHEQRSPVAAWRGSVAGCGEKRAAERSPANGGRAGTRKGRSAGMSMDEGGRAGTPSVGKAREGRDGASSLRAVRRAGERGSAEGPRDSPAPGEGANVHGGRRVVVHTPSMVSWRASAEPTRRPLSPELLRKATSSVAAAGEGEAGGEAGASATAVVGKVEGSKAGVMRSESRLSGDEGGDGGDDAGSDGGQSVMSEVEDVGGGGHGEHCARADRPHAGMGAGIREGQPK